MFEKLKKERDPRGPWTRKIFDDYPYANTAVTNFYDRFMKGERLKGWIKEQQDAEGDLIE
jgi:hypothetical protein